MSKLELADESAIAEIKSLSHLVSVGHMLMEDLDSLGIHSAKDLAKCKAKEMYKKLCLLKKGQVDPCCEHILHAAIMQAKKDLSASMINRKLGPDVTSSGRQQNLTTQA